MLKMMAMLIYGKKARILSPPFLSFDDGISTNGAGWLFFLRFYLHT
jgi:hypothetical protein